MQRQGQADSAPTDTHVHGWDRPACWGGLHTMIYNSQSANLGCCCALKGNCCTLQVSKQSRAFRTSRPDTDTILAASCSGRASSSSLDTRISTSITADSDGAGTRIHKHLLRTGSRTCMARAAFRNVWAGTPPWSTRAALHCFRNI